MSPNVRLAASVGLGEAEVVDRAQPRFAATTKLDRAPPSSSTAPKNDVVHGAKPATQPQTGSHAAAALHVTASLSEGRVSAGASDGGVRLHHATRWAAVHTTPCRWLRLSPSSSCLMTRVVSAPKMIACSFL
jgi:hypothetical protein